VKSVPTVQCQPSSAKESSAKESSARQCRSAPHEVPGAPHSCDLPESSLLKPSAGGRAAESSLLKPLPSELRCRFVSDEIGRNE
jgi:hypothetical protein